VKYQAYIALPHEQIGVKAGVPDQLGMAIKQKWLLTAAPIMFNGADSLSP
jgi:hypothetical protein